MKRIGMKFKIFILFVVIGGIMFGKIYFVWKLLECGNEMFDVFFSKIIYCYMED